MFRCATVLAFAALATAVTFTQVQSDFTTISNQLTTLTNAINAFPTTGGTLLEALTIHDDAQTLITDIEDATSDVTSFGALTDTEGDEVLTTFNTIEPQVLTALKDLVAKKAAFAALPLGGVTSLVESDLESLNTSTVALENALITEAPADLKPNATTIANTINAALASAIADYAS